MTSIDKLDQAIEPKKLLSLWVKLLILTSLGIAGVSALRIVATQFKNMDDQAKRKLDQENINTYKRDWFIAKEQEILALKHQLKTEKELFTSIDHHRKAAWISRASDRTAYNEAMSRVLETEEKLKNLVTEYNSVFVLAPSTETAGLHSNITLD